MRENKFSAYLILIPIAIACFLIGASLRPQNNFRFYNTNDEGFYFHYAAEVGQNGPGAFPKLAREYLDHADPFQYFPPPVRITTVGLGALAMRALGKSFLSLQCLSLFSLFALLLITFQMVRQFHGTRTAAWTAFLLSVSPLQLAMGRRALSDSLVAAAIIACFSLLTQTLRKPVLNKTRYLLISVLYAFTFLTREGTLFLIPISWLLILPSRKARPVKETAFFLACTSLVPLALALVTAGFFLRGFGSVFEILRLNWSSTATNAYAQQYGGGPWFRYLLDYFLLSPLTLLGFIGWLGMIGFSKPGRTNETDWAWIAITYLLISLPFVKFIRYALFLDLPIRMGSVLFVRKQLAELSRRKQLFWEAAIFLCVAATDARAFWLFFVRGEIYDPTTALLCAHRGILLFTGK